MDTEQQEPRIITVNSESQPGVQYSINLDTLECDCPHFVNRLKPQNDIDGGNRICKHIQMVQRLQAE